MGGRLTKSESQQIFTTTQVGKICGVSQQAVIKWIDSGRLAGYRLPNSRARRVTREALLKFMEANHIPTRALRRDVIRVLVVDDEEIIADMVELEFEDDNNVEVHKALRGFDAGVVLDYQPDVVILDIMLPDMDGRRVCELIREGAGGKDVRIIGVSGYADSLNVEEMLAGGFDAFIAKPFMPGQIRDAVMCRPLLSGT
jgi:excisionase family DNA binding protein